MLAEREFNAPSSGSRTRWACAASSARTRSGGSSSRGSSCATASGSSAAGSMRPVAGVNSLGHSRAGTEFVSASWRAPCSRWAQAC